MGSNIIQETLSHQYGLLGRAIAKKPLYFVTAPFLLTLAFSLGMLRLQVERDIESLWVVTNGRAMRSQREVERLFPMNSSSHPLRLPKKKNLIFVMMFSRDGGNILREEIFQDILSVEEDIQRMQSEWSGVRFNYSGICVKSNNRCFENNIRNFEQLFVNNNYRKKVKYPIHIDPLTFAHTFFAINIGGVTLDDNDHIQEAKAIRLVYLVDDTTEEKALWSKQWQKTLFERMQSLMTKYLSIQIYSTFVVENGLSEVTSDLLPLVTVIGFVVAIFSMISCMTDNWVQCKPWFGLSSCVSAVLALFSSFGFAMMCGVKYADLIITLPLLILGTEVDNAYILLAAWRRTNTQWRVEERMGKAYSDAAVSVTITSLTNLLSFCVGMTTPYPAIQIFCAYAASAIVFSFVYLLSFCGGVLALSGYREERGQHPFTCRSKDDPSLGKLNKKLSGDSVMVFVRETLGGLLTFSSAKVIVLLLFFANLAAGIWGILYLKEGNELTDGFHEDNSITSTIRNNYKFFSDYPFPINVVINEPLNYHDPEVQMQIQDIMRSFESHSHIASEKLTVSWLKYYLLFLKSPVSFFLLRGYQISEKQGFIDGLRDVFLNFPIARQFQADIIFNENFTEITASRFVLISKDVRDHSDEQSLYKSVNDIAAKSPIPLTIHSIMFPLFELSHFIRSVVIQLGLVTAGLLCVIFFIFVPVPKCALVVTVVVVSSMVETIGYMAFWGVRLDIMSTLILILSVGFTINYPAHISFAFVTHESDNPNDRTKHSVYAVGFPIVQGSLTTILSVAILIYRKSYMLNVCLKIMVLVVIHTTFHSMFFIPVILNVAETWFTRRKPKKEIFT